MKFLNTQFLADSTAQTAETWAIKKSSVFWFWEQSDVPSDLALGTPLTVPPEATLLGAVQLQRLVAPGFLV